MANNMASKTSKYLYISSWVSYTNQWEVDFDIVNVKDIIIRSDKSKNVAILDGGQYGHYKHWKIYISNYRSVTKTHEELILYNQRQGFHPS